MGKKNNGSSLCVCGSEAKQRNRRLGSLLPLALIARGNYEFASF